MEGFAPGGPQSDRHRRAMNIRYIDGFPAVVDADLALRGR